MKISLIVIGKKMPDWLEYGITHYVKQMPPSMNFSLVAIDAPKRKGRNIDQIKKIEGDLLTAASMDSNIVIAFDEKGIQNTTTDIANNLHNWQQNGDKVSLLIGGADGLSSECKSSANQLWGLSNLTLPHSIARLLAVEQIYRANSILINHPYHRQ